MEGYSLQRSGNWFWHPGQKSLNASEIWQHWKQAVGRGTHLLLNVPPNSTGIVPDEYKKELSAFGSALKMTMAKATAASGNVGVVAYRAAVAVNCSSAAGDGKYLQLELGEGAVVDMVQIREDVANSGQRVGAYTLETRSVGGQWVPLTGAEVHGETVGHRVVDLFDAVNITGLRWRWQCQKDGVGEADAAHLAIFSAHQRHPLLRL
jgi:alpha-L-fucosidase